MLLRRALPPVAHLLHCCVFPVAMAEIKLLSQAGRAEGRSELGVGEGNLIGGHSQEQARGSWRSVWEDAGFLFCFVLIWFGFVAGNDKHARS